MALKSQIENDVKAALLGGDRFRAEVLRGLKAAILNEEVAKGKRDEGLDDASIEQLIAKEVKKRLDSVQQYTDAARPELAEAEQAEAKVLQSGVLAEAKASMRFSKDISKVERRKKAIIRKERKADKLAKARLGVR